MVTGLLWDGPGWQQPQQKYPGTVNTLVIYSTDIYHDAYFHDNGCGLMTYFFTKFASELNEPLSVVLTEVRKEVTKHMKKEQVLVFEDRLMDNIYLLAESKGEGN